MPKIEVSGNDPDVMFITNQLFGVLDGRNPRATVSDVDAMRALLALRNAFATVGIVAIEAGAAAEANTPELLDAVDANRQTVLRIVDELRGLLATHRPRPPAPAKRILMN